MIGGAPRRRTLDRARRVSFRTRLGTFSAVAVGVTVALASLAAWFTVRHQLFSQVDSSLRSDMATFQGFSRDGSVSVGPVSGFVRRNGGFVQIIDSNGLYYSSLQGESGSGTNAGIAPTKAQQAEISASSGSRIDTIRYQGALYRVLTEPALVTTPVGFDKGAIEIARPLSEVDHTLSDLRLILWLVSLGGIAVAVGLGWVIGRTTLRPVERLTAAAEHVAATQDLSATIDEAGDDELSRLARAFNSMLVALAASRQQQAQLISDAGHELRTPLTSLRTNIEVLLRRPDLPADDRAELVADVEAQLEELTTLIGDVVDMAREDERHSEPIEVRLDAIVSHAVERARRRAPDARFDTHITTGSVRAQPALLERAVLNVLDNAAKWGPPGGTISVWLQRGGCWTLDVRDEGPGIAAEDLPHVFDRFYRAQTARSMPGSGLGLAIVRQVVEHHGGTVSASCPPEGGTVVHIELPIVAESEPDQGPEWAVPAEEPARAQ